MRIDHIEENGKIISIKVENVNFIELVKRLNSKAIVLIHFVGYQETLRLAFDSQFEAVELFERIQNKL